MILGVSALIIAAGVGFTLLDPYIYPVAPSVVPRLVQGVLGATMAGWGATMLLVARYAFEKKQPGLLRLLLYGMLVWAPLDMAVSVYYLAWFNVALNLVLVAGAGIPLYLASKNA